MIMPEEISVGNVLDYLTEDHGWQPSVMDWQDLKWLTEDPKGFNAVHRPRAVTDDELKLNGLDNDFIVLGNQATTVSPEGIQINFRAVHAIQIFYSLLNKKPLTWKTSHQESTT